MHQNRFVEHLRPLSRREMTRFREFAESPYFNKHDGVRALVQYLSEIFPDFNSRNCYRAHLAARLRPAGVAPGQLAVLFTYGMRLLEAFLSQEAWQRDTGAGQFLLLAELRQRGFHRSYERILRQNRRRLDQSERRDAAYLQQRLRLADEADGYYTLTGERQRDETLGEKEYYLDCFFLAEKLRDACELVIRRRLLRLEHQSSLLEAVLREVGQHPERYESAPPVRMYFQLYRLLTQGQPADYEQALQTLENTADSFGLPEQKMLYNYLQNFCIQRINQGEPAYLREVFHLYQTQLAANLLIEEGYLSEWHYKNIVTTGIRLQEMEWVHGFIEGFREHLHPEARDNAYRFNLASLYHAQGAYDRVLALLPQVEYGHPRYHLGAKALLLRTYYELDEHEALRALVSSMRQYLRRNRLLADFRRLGYGNLFRFTSRAAAIRENQGYLPRERSRRDLEKLKREVEKAETVFNKGWLEEKIGQLAVPR